MSSQSNGAVCIEISGKDDAKHAVVDGGVSPDIPEIGNGDNHIGNNQQPTVVVDPHDEDEYLERKISGLRAAYDKFTDHIYRLLNLVAAFTAIFSGRQNKGPIERSSTVILSAIVCGGFIAAILGIYYQQFQLRRRVKLVLEERKSLVDRCRREGIRLKSMSRSNRSEVTVFDGEEDDDLDFWWFPQRAAFVVSMISFSIWLLFSLV